MKLYVLFTGLLANNYLSGGDQLFLDLAERLPKGIELTVITPEFAKKHWQNINRIGTKFKYLPKNIFDSYNHPVLVFFSYIVRAWQVYFLLKKEKKIDVIYSCSDVAYADIWPAFLISNSRPNINWVSRIYHVLISPQKRQGNKIVNYVAFFLQRLSFYLIEKRSKHILALNNKLRKELLTLGFPEKKLGVLGAGIDFKKINKFKQTKKFDYDAVVLGRIAPVKGIFDMVKIWKHIHNHNPKWKLAWIGTGSNAYTKRLKTLINENGLKNSFYLLGYLEKEDVFNVFKGSKLFLCPDHENGWGLAISEAMSLGLPVVSFNIDIFGSVYKKGFRSVRIYDTKNFAKEVINILENKKLRKKLSTEAISQASEFNLDTVAEKLITFLKTN